MLRILVLEDETYSREALRKILQEISQEITVYAAADLVSARLLLDTVSFDLFLLDVNLNPENSTDCSGIEFAKEILVKEIRAKQHDYDNHLNAILNMHLTIDTYDELVLRQSEYIQEVRADSTNRYLSLLRISDKVLAGFLYSKIISSPENVETDVEVRNWKVISRVSEHSLIEMVGVLVDNAYEATAKEGGKVRVFLDSKDDCLIFDVFNEYPKLSLEEIGHFFDRGYTTKQSEIGKHGIGLAKVKKLTQHFGGELTVGQEEIDGTNYIHFTLHV